MRGGRDNDIISGDVGNDLIYGDRGIDTLTGGDGKDIFFLQKGIGGETLAQADIITDFADGEDVIGLISGLQLADLNVFQGTGANATDTIIQDTFTGQFLTVLKGVNRSAIDSTDFSIPGVFTFSSPTFQVKEDGTPVQAVTVTRTDGLNSTASVTVTSSNGSATAPTDYNNTPVVMNFGAGETSKTVTIPIVNDAVGEYTETVNLSLTSASDSAQIGAGNTAVLQIVDNDALSVPKLTFLNPTPFNDILNISVAALGNNVLMGAPFTDIGAENAGVVYLFDGSTGVLLKTFLNPTPEVDDQFGYSVAAVGNNVLIGARSDNTGAVLTGAAYLFDGTTGDLLQTFLPTKVSLDGNNYYFGDSITAVGNKVAIGTRFAGVVYLFDSTTGALLQTFSNPRPNPGAMFGRVGTVDNNVLIGAPFDNAIATNNGVAYLFDSATGELLQTFLNPTPGQGEYEGFGVSVVGVGNNVLIGVPGDDTGGQNSGAAYLFDRTTGTLLQTYLNPTPESEDSFGFSIAALGNNILIAAGGDNQGTGAVYLF